MAKLETRGNSLTLNPVKNRGRVISCPCSRRHSERSAAQDRETANREETQHHCFGFAAAGPPCVSCSTTHNPTSRALRRRCHVPPTPAAPRCWRAPGRKAELRRGPGRAINLLDSSRALLFSLSPRCAAIDATQMMLINGAVSSLESNLLANKMDPRFARRKVRCPHCPEPPLPSTGAVRAAIVRET